MPRPRKSLDERLAELNETQAQLQARRQALLNEKKAQDRKQDARRKIIVGAAVLAHAELHPVFAAQLREVLEIAVTRSIDRVAIRDLLRPTSSESASAT